MAVTGVALVAGVALIALVGAVIFVIALPHSTSPRHLAKRKLPVPAKTWFLSWYQLGPGDCLNSSNLGLGTDDPFPGTVTAVPCTQRHLGEVYFAGDLWPESQAKYPGDGVASKAADTRCRTAFGPYVGIDISESALAYEYWYPAGGNDWGEGDRQVVCVAYDPDVPFNFSVKGTGA